jgi:hypothetical protein
MPKFPDVKMALPVGFDDDSASEPAETMDD